MSKLGTEPYKGVRDFYPEDMKIQNYIFDTWRKAAESFGYVEYGASILEPAELYKSKTSEEIVNQQTFTFIDRGGREVVLRPEMTPTLARMVAARRKSLKFPLRWYSIPNVFRYEQPQRGRKREHWQLNCDVIGIASIEADVEIISLAHAIIKAFGAKDEDFEIRVNTMKGKIKGIKDNATPEQNLMAKRLIDKKDKMSTEDFLTEARRLLGETLILELKSPDDLKYEQHESIKELICNLTEKGLKNVRFDESLARGFDYYTGIVFEVFDTNPNNPRSILGGGRYDNLLEIFDVEPVPTIGFGMGDITTRDFLETHKLGPYA